MRDWRNVRRWNDASRPWSCAARVLPRFACLALAALCVAAAGAACNDGRSLAPRCEAPPCQPVALGDDAAGGGDLPDDAGGPEADANTRDVIALDVGIAEDASDADVECVPECGRRECGDDGCGGVCGVCVDGWSCVRGACEPPPAVDVSPAGLTCEELIGCFEECQFEACFEECFFSGSVDAQRQYEAVVTCISERCEDVAGDPEALSDCQFEECGAEIATCLGVESVGEGSCDDIIECMLDCTTESCVQDCFFVGDVDARESVVAFFECAQDPCFEFGFGPDFFACGEEFCADTLDACE